ARTANYKGDAANRLEKPEIEQQIQRIENRRPPAVERFHESDTHPEQPRTDVLDLKKVVIPALPQTRKDIAPVSPRVIASTPIPGSFPSPAARCRSPATPERRSRTQKARRCRSLLLTACLK